MGGRDAGKGFEYQDLCALLRVVELYEPGTPQSVQVEDVHKPVGDRSEPWDIRILNAAPSRDWAFSEELWQAKDTSITKNQCCVYWKNLHKFAHDGELSCAAAADIHNDVALGLITSAPLQRDIERFRQFTECLRSYHLTPERSDLEKALQEDYMGVDLDEFANLLTNEMASTLGQFDFNPESNGSIYWFRRFVAEQCEGQWIRDRTLLTCARRLGIGIPDSKEAYEASLWCRRRLDPKRLRCRYSLRETDLAPRRRASYVDTSKESHRQHPPSAAN